ncbi:MAG: type II toxin-antitoxin system VapC family toxin [Thermoproteus sp. AZ2]|jgi:predicted nucleic acid-binding protein|uniref:Type II toxin-antitoxin system VapC family toxin n=1 Tax=Thermoproteus sp. AZ2 TaxID=1609232 RepID=A0ACC6V3N3_9CREN
MERCILDTSLLISKRIDIALKCKHRLVTPVVVLEYLTWAKKSAEAAAGPRREGYLRLMRLFPHLLAALDVEVVNSITIDDVGKAVELAISRGVSMGDALISAEAVRQGAVVLTRDKDWARLPEVKSVIV